ncbi:hypothetical protein CU044_0618 [Streptomyces sp. L-9-10]|nr:hypothetical protein CU044_0618 [Streptomyces sp. L-9-10]
MRTRRPPGISGQSHHIPMRHRHTLRHTRRTRREHHIRQSPHRHPHGKHNPTHRHRIHRDGRYPTDLVHRSVGQHEHRVALLDDLTQSLLRVRHVQRDIRPARLQYRQHGHQDIRRALQQQPDTALRTDAPLDQPPRQPVCPIVELAVRQRKGAALHRHRIRGSGHPLAEDPHQGGPGPQGRTDPAATPLTHHSGTFGLAQQVDVPDGGVGVRDQSGDRVSELRRQPLRRARVEQRRVVGERHVQPVAGRRRDQCQRVVGRLHGLGRADAQSMALGRGLVHRVVLEDDQAVEERRTGRHVRVDVGQRHVLVAPRLRLSVLDLPQPVGDRLVRSGGHPDGECVDEETEDVLGPRQIRRTPRHRRTEHHVGSGHTGRTRADRCRVRRRGSGRRGTGRSDTGRTAGHPRVLREHQRPRALDQRVRRDPVAAGVTAHLLRHTGLQRDPYPLAGLSAPGLLGHPVVRQWYRLLESGQHTAPVVGGRVVVPRAQPAHVLAERPTVRRKCRRTRRRRPAERRVLSQDVGEERGRTPAVEQQVVERPHHTHHIVGDTGQGDPHQRRGGQIESARPVLAEEVTQQGLLPGLVGTRPVQVRHGYGHLPVHHLHRFPDRFPGQRDPQRVRPFHCPLPGVREPGKVVDPVQGEGELLQIGGRVGLGQRVEEHARLEGRQRVDVLDLSAVTRDAVHPALREPHEREVRRGATARVRFGAVRDEVREFGGEVVHQRPHRLLSVQPRGVVPREHQPAVEESRGHIEEVGPSFPDAVFSTGVESGRAVPVVRTARHVQSAEVVEADQRVRVVCCRVAEAAQRAVADTAVGYGPELLLHPLDRGSPVVGRGQRERDRVDGGEPADGTGQIEVVEQLLAAMALQIDRDPVMARPGTERARQRGQQRVVDLGAVDGGDPLEELLCRLPCQLAGHHGLVGDGVGAARVVEGDVRPRSVHDGAPVRDLVVEAARRRVLREPRRPLLYGGGLGAEFHGPAGGGAGVRGPEVFEEDAPGHPVHDEVVGDDDHPQGLTGRAGADQDADQWTVLQAEPGLRGVLQRLPGRILLVRLRVGEVVNGEYAVEVDAGGDPSRPPAVRVLGECRPQRVMVEQECAYRLPERGQAGGRREFELHGHVEVGGVGGVRGEEPVADRGRAHLPRHHALLRHRPALPCVGRCGTGGESGHGLAREHIAGGEFQPCLPGP